MKPYSILLVAIFLLSINHVAGQQLSKDLEKKVSDVTGEDIYRAGVWNFNLNEVLNVQSETIHVDRFKRGNINYFRGMMEANYFLIDNFGIGAGISFSGYHANSTGPGPLLVQNVSNSSVIGGNFNLLYGRNIGGIINLTTMATVGGGSYTDFFYRGLIPDGKSNGKFYFLGLFVGSPFQVQRNIFVTPYLNYEFRHDKQASGDIFTRNSFKFGVNMEFFMGYMDDICDCSDDPYPVSKRYRKGHIILGSGMYGGFQIGTEKTIYDYGDLTYERKEGINNTYLSGYILYFLMNYLAVGACIDYSGNHENNKDLDYRIGRYQLLFNPMVRYHLPVNNMLTNLFGEGSAGVGFKNNIYDDRTGVSKYKHSLFDWKIGLGYQYNVAEHFSLAPVISYGSTTNNDTDVKIRHSGFYAGVEWNFHIR